MNRLLIILLIFHAINAEKKEIKCIFETIDYHKGSLYGCTPAADPNIIEPLDENVEFTGIHLPGKSDSDVEGFHAITLSFLPLKIHFFPRGFNETFENLKDIYVHETGLKEIHKEDFESLTELRYLNLAMNKIEILEEDLFHANQKLKYLNLHNNKIKFIHPTAMEKLNNLKEVVLYWNVCIDDGALNNQVEIRNVIKKASEICNDTSVYNSYLEKKQGKITLNPDDPKSENGGDQVKISFVFCIYCMLNFLLIIFQ